MFRVSAKRSSARVAVHDRRRAQTSIVVLTFLLCLFVLTSGLQATAQTVVFQSTFEDGTNQGWYAFGSPTLTNTTLAAANSSTRSLLTSGRTASWQGPAHDLSISTFAPGSTFQFSAWVRVTDAEAANGDKVTMSIKRTDASCSSSTCYDTVGPYQAAVTNTWLNLTGSYTVPAGATALTLYFQLANNDDFFIDDVTITSATIPPPTGCAAQDNSGISSTFEGGGLDGWTGRGAATAVNVNTTGHDSVSSLYVSGRTNNWNGAQIGVDNKMCVGSQYSVSVWVKLDPADSTNHVVNISMQTTYNGSTAYTSVTSYPGVTIAADGAWHQITVPAFTVGNQYDANQAFLYLQTVSSSNDFVSFYMDDFKLTYLPPLAIEPNIESVYQHYANYFAVGAALVPSDLTGARAQLLAKHFNSMTSGNDMKWDATERTENTFTYTNADAQVAFAQAHNMQVRGHTLLWHSQTPNWVFLRTDGVTPLDPGTPADVDLLKARLQNHIHNLMTHFGNKVWAWDVANEVIDESQSDCLRRSSWYNIIGPTYLDLVFQYARAESATAKLYLNDYNTTTGAKQVCFYNVVQGMIQRGVPIDGVGHQMHNNLWYPPVQSFIDTVNLFHGLTTIAQVPLDQQVTEMDESIYGYPPPQNGYAYDQIPTDLLVQEGYIYRDYFEAMKQLNSNAQDKKISSVTIWGMSDDESWLNSRLQTGSDAPLLFDTKLQHKLAYTGIIDPLSLPGADLAITMTADTTTAANGTPVTFTATVTNNGHDQAANVVLTDVLPSNLVFTSGVAPAGWSCTTPAVGSTGTITCTTATMDNGATAQFTLVATVASGAQVTNTVTVASDSRDPNPDASNNTASITLQMASLTPSSLTFPATNIGAGAGAQKVTFTNHTSDGVTITPTVTGPFAIWENYCTGTIAPGASCIMLIGYVPQVAGAESGTLSVSYTGGTVPLTVALSGTGVGQLQLTTTALTFAATNIGSATAAQRVGVLNRTGATITITPSITGSFYISTNGCAGSLAPNSACYIFVNYLASAAGQQTGQLTITPSAGSPQTVSLTGTGNAGDIQVSPTALTFAATNVGSATSSQRVGILNRTGVGITISPAITGSFRISVNTCTGTIAPNNGCYIFVQYRPTIVGQQTGTLTITPSAGTPHDVSLTGTGQ